MLRNHKAHPCTQRYTKSVTPEVILFRMFHTASYFLSACPMLSVPNSLTLHDIHACTLQPFVHSCPPLAIHTVWVWLIRQYIGSCQLRTSKSFATSSKHKNLQMLMEYDTTWSWSSLNFGGNTLPKKNVYLYKGRVWKRTETKETMVTTVTVPLKSPRSQPLTTSWTGLPTLVRSSKKHSWQIKYSYAAIWEQRFFCTC